MSTRFEQAGGHPLLGEHGRGAHVPGDGRKAHAAHGAEVDPPPGQVAEEPVVEGVDGDLLVVAALDGNRRLVGDAGRRSAGAGHLDVVDDVLVVQGRFEPGSDVPSRYVQGERGVDVLPVVAGREPQQPRCAGKLPGIVDDAAFDGFGLADLVHECVDALRPHGQVEVVGRVQS
jgi:hypothetical protein